MDLFFFVSILLGFQIVYWFIGYRSSKKLEGKADYFLAKKNIHFFPLMMTFLATTVGGGLFLGSADEAYTTALAYPLGNALGLLFLGLGIGKKLASFNVSTVAQIFEDVYKSPQLKKIASLLSIIALFMILVAQIVASSKLSVLIAIVQQVTNPWISALVGCAVLAAIISTATSLLNAISSNLCTDFKQIYEIKSIKWLTASIALAAFLFAFVFDNIVSILIQSYDLYVSCLFVPLFIAFFKKEGTSLSALFSVLFGAASFFLFKFITISIPHEIASLLFSLGGFFIGEVFATLSAKQKALP